MAAPQKRSFTLPNEQATCIGHLVESGTYASASEVIRVGIRALQERDVILSGHFCPRSKDRFTWSVRLYRRYRQ